jgi:hypothetical protein
MRRDLRVFISTNPAVGDTEGEDCVELGDMASKPKSGLFDPVDPRETTPAAATPAEVR